MVIFTRELNFSLAVFGIIALFIFAISPILQRFDLLVAHLEARNADSKSGSRSSLLPSVPPNQPV